jgi:hypothetical protein
MEKVLCISQMARFIKAFSIKELLINREDLSIIMECTTKVKLATEKPMAQESLQIDTNNIATKEIGKKIHLMDLENKNGVSIHNTMGNL